MEQKEALKMVTAELNKRQKEVPNLNSSYEGYAFILEETAALWESIQYQARVNPDKEELADAAAILAAMILRFIIDLC